MDIRIERRYMSALRECDTGRVYYRLIPFYMVIQDGRRIDSFMYKRNAIRKVKLLRGSNGIS